MLILESFFGLIGDLTWGWSLIPFLLIFGLFFTIATDFVQFRFFKRMFRVLLTKNQTSDQNAISGREALLLSIGGRVGGGNIAGVAVAITLGGPGAVFWMWAVALIGMATSLVECSLAQLYKRVDGDVFRGGPARTIIHGLGKDYKWLAYVYSICLIASFAIGFSAFQGNTVAGVVVDSLGIDRIYTGAFLAVIVSFIIYGGIHRIAKTTDVIVPIMAIAYIGISLLIIIMNISDLPAVILTIVKNAFGIEEVVSGGMGAAVANGLRRGLFSNEAGLGSAPNVAATADVTHPISQGITQSLSVFIDTIVVCSCTAFVILLGNVYVPGETVADGAVLSNGYDFFILFQFHYLQLLLGRKCTDLYIEKQAGVTHPTNFSYCYRIHWGCSSNSNVSIFLFRSNDGYTSYCELTRSDNAVPYGNASVERLPKQT